jgi:uncharacterized membrane-anchored protein YhcB (DUF1043 family)
MSSFSHTLIPFIAGLIIGGLAIWLLLPTRRNLQRLEQEKKKAEDALATYRKEVDNHFVRTAELVNNMTQAYRAVHEQLAEGAQALCSEDSKQLVMSKTLLTLTATQVSAEEKPHIKQPLDYAPSSKGTLSEDFGFKKKTFSSDTSGHAGPNAPRDYAEGCADQGCSPMEDKEKSA